MHAVGVDGEVQKQKAGGDNPVKRYLRPYPDLMIRFLRGELDKHKRDSTWSTANQSAIMFYPPGPLNSSASNVVLDAPNHRPEEDSLCFSRDYSREMESMSSILTTHQPFFPKKECVVVNSSS